MLTFKITPKSEEKLKKYYTNEDDDFDDETYHQFKIESETLELTAKHYNDMLESIDLADELSTIAGLQLNEEHIHVTLYPITCELCREDQTDGTKWKIIYRDEDYNGHLLQRLLKIYFSKLFNESHNHDNHIYCSLLSKLMIDRVLNQRLPFIFYFKRRIPETHQNMWKIHMNESNPNFMKLIKQPKKSTIGVFERFILFIVSTMIISIAVSRVSDWYVSHYPI